MLLNISSIKKAKQIFASNKFYGFYVLMNNLIKEIKFVSYLYNFYHNYSLINYFTILSIRKKIINYVKTFVKMVPVNRGLFLKITGTGIIITNKGPGFTGTGIPVGHCLLFLTDAMYTFGTVLREAIKSHCHLINYLLKLIHTVFVIKMWTVH